MATENSRNNSIRVALIGTGYIADYHIDAVRSVPGAEVRAVCDLNRARAERFAATHGVPQAYASLDELLSKDRIDVIHVLTPPNAHLEAARSGLEAGVDALVEKPLCLTSDACLSLRELADRKHRALGTSHNFLFFPVYDQLIADLRVGRLGRVDHVDIVWNKPLAHLKGGPWSAWMLQHPQNILFEVAPHSFAHLIHLVGRPDRILVYPYDRIELPLGHTFYRQWEILSWTGERSARLRFSFVEGYPEHYIHVRGTQAVAHCDFETNTYLCLDHTPHGRDVDLFLTVAAASRRAVVQAAGTLAGVVLTKARLRKSGGPFQHSIARTVQSFYANRTGQMDERVSASIGEQVVSVAEWVAREADLPALTTKASRRSSTGAVPRPSVLVLGGTGFIGRALVRRLRQDGHHVRVLARDPKNCPQELQAPGIEVVRGDLTEIASIAAALPGIKTVYHLARGFGPTWPDYLKHDVEPTRAMVGLCLQHGITRFLYTSSIAIYYAGKRAGTITEETLPTPVLDSYARSKVENERNLLELYSQERLPVVIFRPGIVLGHGGCPLHWGVAGWPYPSVARLWGSGNNRLPIVLVDDCVDAMVRALSVAGIEGRSYNVVGPPMLTANEYLDALESRAGIKLRRIPTPSWRHFGEALAKWAVKRIGRDPNAQRPSYSEWEGRTFAATLDGGRAERELGWMPTRERATVIQEGIYVPVDEWFELRGSAGAARALDPPGGTKVAELARP
ncbi:MAG TPA: NAD-dependent epimerase/dehydratase family protein [Myxococcota bacterium]|nr:NAD-dependent epimerase/dehydratase family protein [Myxococcota bacterium]